MTFVVSLPEQGTLTAWRAAARRAISHRIAPDKIDWSGGGGLFHGDPLPDGEGPHSARVPSDFIDLLGSVIWHSETERFDLLYRALWRLDARDANPLSQTDPIGHRLHLMAKSVRRDIHKMHAFVRFRELAPHGDRRSFGAWFEPEHNALEPGVGFFVKRFSDMDWVIATPKLTACFEAGRLTFAEGGRPQNMPADASEELWATYFANIFNPARIKLDAMRSEMPKKYWKNLPETQLIPAMLEQAEARVRRMHAAGAASPRPGSAAISRRYRAALPQPREVPLTLADAQAAAAQCRRCGLCEAASQTVWGRGPNDAAIMIVGEQPGDQEDLCGEPFVGPAGTLLRSIMSQAGLAPENAWLTNAVKHFKFTPRGKQRLHKNPSRSEIEHCRWWLRLELALIQPRITLALGASAAFALTDDDSPVSQRRGRVETGLHGGPVLVSWHPSYILRSPDPQVQARLKLELSADIATAMPRAAATL
jgi:DNA polymerase